MPIRARVFAFRKRGGRVNLSRNPNVEPPQPAQQPELPPTRPDDPAQPEPPPLPPDAPTPTAPIEEPGTPKPAGDPPVSEPTRFV